MDNDRKVVEYRRKPDGTYEPIEMEPSVPRHRESNERKRLRELADYGNTVCRVKDGGRWAELRLVHAGTYTVVGEKITVPETYTVSQNTKSSYMIPIDMPASSKCTSTPLQTSSCKANICKLQVTLSTWSFNNR